MPELGARREKHMKHRTTGPASTAGAATLQTQRCQAAPTIHQPARITPPRHRGAWQHGLEHHAPQRAVSKDLARRRHTHSGRGHRTRHRAWVVFGAACGGRPRARPPHHTHPAATPFPAPPQPIDAPRRFATSKQCPGWRGKVGLRWNDPLSRHTGEQRHTDSAGCSRPTGPRTHVGVPRRMERNKPRHDRDDSTDQKAQHPTRPTKRQARMRHVTATAVHRRRDPRERCHTARGEKDHGRRAVRGGVPQTVPHDP